MQEATGQMQRYRYHKKAPLEERFWAQVEKTSEHWWWKGTTDKHVYGYICSGGSAWKGAKYKRCHRVAWELLIGPIPSGMNVLHSCDTPGCVNPDHLFLGSHLDNAKDRNAKGRNAYGERSPNAKLTENDVREIRRRYTAGGISQMKLAAEFQVDQTIISDVVRRNSWNHVN